MAGEDVALYKRVRKDGSVGWQVVVDDYDAATGKRRRRIVGTFSPKKRAQKEEREALDKLEKGAFVVRSRGTVGDLLDLWLESRSSLRRNTLVGYRTAIERHWKPRIGHMAAQSLEPELVQSIVNEWASEGMYRTAQVNIRVLSAACAHGVGLRLLSFNPCEGVITPSDPEPPERTVWSEAEVATFLRHAEEHPLSLLWFTLLETGMRRSEALGLHWSSVDWDSPALLVSQTAVQNKTKGEATMKIQPMGKTSASRRAILVSNGLIERFRSWRKDNTSSMLVFSNAHGQPLTPTWVRKQLDDLAEAAGVPRVTIHELRHIAATRMMRAGVPLVVAQQRMGHASSEMLTRIYQHSDADLQRNAVDSLDALSNAANALSNAAGSNGIRRVDTGTG